MVTPLEERAASVVTGKQPILGWKAAARSRRKIRRAARQHHTRSFSLLGSDDAVPAVDIAH